MPYLSVVIPCRNRPHELSELLSQIHHQTVEAGHRVEVIVVDDGSRPALETAVRHRREGVTFIRSEHSCGAPDARRRGLARAHGEVVHFHDSDDLLGPGWIAAVVGSFTADVDLDVLITSRAVQAERNGPLEPVHPRIVHRLVRDLARFRHYQLFQNAIGPLGGVTFHRRVIEVGDIPDVPASQDWLMYDAALVRARKVAVRDDVHFVFRTFGGDRISGRPLRRVKGFIAAARRRFAGRRAQRLATILYCAVAGPGVARIANARPAWLWRALCRRLALSPTLARLVLGRRAFTRAK